MPVYLEVEVHGRRVSITPRERDVLIARCRPLESDEPFPQAASSRAIAAELVVSEAAVKQHLLNLYAKFAVPDGTDNRRLQLATVAIRAGAVDGQIRPSRAPVDGRRAAAQDAMTRRDWATAVATLSSIDTDPAQALDPAELDALADATRWSGNVDQALATRERAHALAIRGADPRMAAWTALGLVVDAILLMQFASASGWQATARRALEGQPEGREHGYLAFTLALVETTGDAAEAGIEHARKALSIGRRLGDRDLEVLGIVFEGFGLARLGRIEAAFPLLDEAMAAVATGELGPLATGLVYCRTVSACLDAFDYRRAYEWTEAIRRRGVAIGSIGFPGDCRTHRAAVHLAHGDWGLGAEEAELACVETISFDRGHTALALTGLGEIRLRQGAFDDAESAFHRALGLGMDPQPGRARLVLARGDVHAAFGAIRTAVADAGEDAVRLAALLPAQAEIEIAAGDIAAARSTADRLHGVVGASRSAALRASVAMVDGLVLLADGDSVGATGPLRQAVRGWLEIGAPFEAGRSRFALAQALQARGDAESAQLEAGAARDAFDRLGAGPDREACDRFLARRGAVPADA